MFYFRKTTSQILPKFDSTRAYQYLKDQCALGPRNAGSEGHHARYAPCTPEQLANPASYPPAGKREPYRDIGKAAADIDKLVTDLKAAN